MEAYTVFADIYDDFMGNIPYEKWCNNICGILARNNIVKGIVAELGCGTGTMTRLMAGRGYDMIGIDSSEDMLAIAREEECEDILYLLQDMRKIELYGTVSAVISVCDSMNYLAGEGELTEVLRHVNLFLERDGIFIFDMKTEYCYENILGDTIQYEETEDCSLIWENHFERETRIHSYELTMFIDYDEKQTFERYKESHMQRSYSIDEVKKAVKEARMELLDVIDANTLAEPVNNTERVYFIVKEGFQADKKYS